MTDPETSWEGGIGARFWSVRRCTRKKVMDQERLFHYIIIFGPQKTSGFMFLLMIFLVFWKRTQIQIWMKMRHFGVDRVSKLGLESRLAITTQGSNNMIASWGAYLVFFGLVIGFILVEKCCPVDYSAWGACIYGMALAYIGWIWKCPLGSRDLYGLSKCGMP